MGVEYGRRVREGIEIREQVVGGVRSQESASGRRSSSDVTGGGGSVRRRRSNPLLAPAPLDTSAGQVRTDESAPSRADGTSRSASSVSGVSDAARAPSRRRTDPKRRSAGGGPAGPTRKPAGGR